jgi:Protein of unknown function (DUF726)
VSLESDTSLRRLHVVIAVDGWLLSKEQAVTNWGLPSLEDRWAEFYSLQWERTLLVKLGTTVANLVVSTAVAEAGKYALASLSTVAAAALAAIALPSMALAATSVIDNSWSLVADRAQKAGKVLAQVLIDRVCGKRPVTLVGYGLGARLIFSCLLELGRRGVAGRGLVDNVFLFGAAVSGCSADRGRARIVPAGERLCYPRVCTYCKRWLAVRATVSGRLVNGYCGNDIVLGLVYRIANLQQGSVAGITSVRGVGVENVDVSSLVDGGLSYPLVLRELVALVELNSCVPNTADSTRSSPADSTPPS